MSKKKLLTAAAGIAFAVILAVVYFVFLRGSDEAEQDGTSNTQNTRALAVENLTEENLDSITVYKSGDISYRIAKDAITNEFLLEGYESYVYSSDFKSILSTVGNLVVVENIEDPLDDSEYGLAGTDSPYTIELKSVDGRTETLYIGDMLVAGNGYYCKKAGGDEIFGVISTVSRFMVEKNTLLSKILATPLDSSRYYYTEKFSLYKDMKEFVTIEFVPEEERESGDAYGAYRMLYPAEYKPSDVNYDTVLSSLVSPEADSIVTTEITEENLEKYGFTRPSFEIYYTLDGQERSLYFGNRTEDGLIYVLSYEFAFIGLASVENRFPFLDWDLVKFINANLFGMNIDYVAKISVSGHGFADSYTLEGKGQELVVTNAKNGEKVDTYNFRQFYRVLLMLRMEDRAETISTDDWLLTFTIETVGGKIYDFRFYRTSTMKCYYTINGKGEFYVSYDELEKVLSDAKKLSAGIKIDADAQL